MAIKAVEDLCERFQLSEHMKKKAVTKWSEASSHNSFNSTSKQTKAILASVCVYITLLEENRPLTITQVCRAIGCNTYEFGKVYTQVTKEFPKYKTESLSIEQLVGVTLIEANFDEEEREALNKRVIDIIGLSRECWLIEGRSPVHIIFGAAFLAWKSLKPNLRSKIKLTQFCNIVNIDYKHTTSERVTEIFNALKKLASKIPGKENFKFTKQNICIYLDDILTYRNSLLYDLNQQIKFGNSRDDQSSSTNSVHWINCFKRKGYDNKCSEQQAKKVKKEIRTESDEEISDSEIDSYIRTKKEVKLIKKLRKLAESDEKDNEIGEYVKLEDFVELEVLNL